MRKFLMLSLLTLSAFVFMPAAQDSGGKAEAQWRRGYNYGPRYGGGYYGGYRPYRGGYYGPRAYGNYYGPRYYGGYYGAGVYTPYGGVAWW